MQINARTTARSAGKTSVLKNCLQDAHRISEPPVGITKSIPGPHPDRTRTVSEPYLLRNFSSRRYLYTEKVRSWYGADAVQLNLKHHPDKAPTLPFQHACLLRLPHTSPPPTAQASSAYHTSLLQISPEHPSNTTQVQNQEPPFPLIPHQ